MQLDPDIRRYYELAPERERLATGAFQLEFERTKEILRDRLPGEPTTILDVGGGPGTYALWLSELGHEVHLIDPVERLVAQARERSSSASAPIASCAVGDARRLDWDDATVDVILELGPLDHLVESDDRKQALEESFRVLKPGGHVFVAAISRFASALDGIKRNLFSDEIFRQIVDSDLREGIHRNPTTQTDYFTTAKFHTPDELKHEIEDARFDAVEVFGVEGPAWLLQDFADRWQDAMRRADLLSIAQRLEREPSLQGVSAHLLAIGTKRSQS